MNRTLCTCVLGMLIASTGLAQIDPPSTETLIKQLQMPRTRSLRNLVPEPAPAPSPAAVQAGADSTGATATPSTAAPAASTANAPAATALASPPSGSDTAGTAVPTVEVLRPSVSLQIQFDFDSARVRPESRQALANLSQALQSPELRESRFAVEGHTDAKGSADYNQRLSAQRALAVRDYLQSLGVDAGRLQASGKGSTDLENTADPFAAQNRRVRIVNLE